GFGGAIISITVDHGIAYLLFLDRSQPSNGRQASKEVWAVGLLAVLTTMGAFGALMLSDFPVLQQLGLFTALGICFSFLFVHTVFPRIFPFLAAAPSRRLILPQVADRLFSTRVAGALVALFLFAGMLTVARPDFNVNLSAMNTLSPETRAAEAHLADAWGNIFSKVFVMTEAGSLAELQNKNDQLLSAMERESDTRLLDHTFCSSMLFPGHGRSRENLSAWHAFWNPERIASVAASLTSAAVENGFKPDAFDAFRQHLEHPEGAMLETGIAPAFFPVLGITREAGAGQWRQFTSLTLPPDDTEEGFYRSFNHVSRIFAPNLFSERLGQLMAHTFLRLLVIVGATVVVLLLIFFLDIKLTLITLSPVVFAMVCTLGTLHLMGRPVDIPGLILSVVVLGMGIDYALFMVRSYQRYGDARHPSFSLIRSAVFMTAASTLIGFGVLAGAEHVLLQSAGIVSFLGIAYSVVGVFLLLPPLLKRYFEAPRQLPSRGMDTHARVMQRYRRLETHAREFARFKMRLDSLFRELAEGAHFSGVPRILVDVGTGYGVPACWLVERFPGVRLFGIEPDADRVRVANRALGAGGRVTRGAAPDLPQLPSPADGAFMLDMHHYLSDEHLALTFKGLHDVMAPGAPLVLRCVLPPPTPGRFKKWADRIQRRIRRVMIYHRPVQAIQAALVQSGFAIQDTAPAGRNGDMRWVRAVKTDPIASHAPEQGDGR
ncbi:MAG: MMPL family transporter, partial [Desulfatitalea sp.]|nr:MMPL family transporter [Desulfatitalea sp.]